MTHALAGGRPGDLRLEQDGPVSLNVYQVRFQRYHGLTPMHLGFVPERRLSKVAKSILRTGRALDTIGRINPITTSSTEAASSFSPVPPHTGSAASVSNTPNADGPAHSSSTLAHSLPVQDGPSASLTIGPRYGLAIEATTERIRPNEVADDDPSKEDSLSGLASPDRPCGVDSCCRTAR